MRTLPDKYMVRYRHERDRNEDRVAPQGGKTEALIYDSQLTEVAIGEAHCRHDENYSKPLGRTIALGRALCELDGTATARRQRKKELAERERELAHAL